MAETRDLEVPWRCPQRAASGATAALPVERTVRFRFTHPGSALDWSEWRSMLEAAPSDGPDYMVCITAFESAVQSAIRDACAELGGSGSGSSGPVANSAMSPATASCLTQAMVQTDAFRRRNAEFNQAAFDRGAPAPVRPMDPTAEVSGLGALGPLGANEAARQLELGCGVPTDPTSRALSLTAEFVTSRLPAIMNGSSMTPDCRNRIVASYLDAAAQSFPRASPPPPAMLQLAAALRAYVPEPARERYEDWQDCFSTTTNPLAVLRGLETEVRQAGQCVAMAPGEGRRLINHADSGTGFPARFHLSRPSADRFVAEINVQFTPADRDAQYREQASQCLRDYAGLMRGPQPPPATGNASLELRLADPATSSEEAVNRIAIDDTATRAMSDRWTATIDCPTITHELLHLLGLVDEYEETMMGRHLDPATGAIVSTSTGADPGLRDFDCRARGPASSIMASQGTAVAEARGSYSALTCTCAGSTGAALEDCRSRLAALTSAAQGCPQIARVAPGRISVAATPPPSADVLAAYESAPEGLSEDGMSFSIRHRIEPRASLLHPAHFRAITQPGCAAANNLYYTCARASRVTSAGHMGGGCLRGLPAACSDPEAWLR